MLEGILKAQNLDKAVKQTVEHSNSTKKKNSRPEHADKEDSLTKDTGNDIKNAVEHITSIARYYDRKIHIEIDKELGITVVKIVDKETNKTIRQIPSEELIELSKRASDLKGLLISKEG